MANRFQSYIKTAPMSDIARKAICEAAIACFGHVLLEGPHVSLVYDPITKTDLVWDFYDERPEGRDGKWLMQLVSLFRDGFMDQIYSPDGNVEHFEMPKDPALAQAVVDDIAASFEFRMYAPYGYMEASQEIKDLVDTYLPPELLVILHEEKKPR